MFNARVERLMLGEVEEQFSEPQQKAVSVNSRKVVQTYH